MEIAALILFGLGIIEGLYICKELKERNALLRQNIAVDKIIAAMQREIENMEGKENDRV